MILQLDPPMPMTTPRGTGVAHFLIDYGLEFNLMWVVFLDDTGECWSFDNTEILAMPNASYGAVRRGPKARVQSHHGAIPSGKRSARSHI